MASHWLSVSTVSPRNLFRASSSASMNLTMSLSASSCVMVMPMRTPDVLP